MGGITNLQYPIQHKPTPHLYQCHQMRSRGCWQFFIAAATINASKYLCFHIIFTIAILGYHYGRSLKLSAL